MKKFIITLLVIIVVGAGAAGWWFMFHRMDGLLEREIQEAGSAAFGTPVTVGNVDIDLIDGAMRIEDLAIGNPPGFGREHALVFGEIEAAIDYFSGEIKRIVLDEAQVFIEERDGQLNVQRLKEALESRLTPSEHRETSNPDEEIVLHQFLMRSTMATFESASLERLTEVRIDQIELRNLRGTPEVVAEQIADAIIDEIVDEAAMALLKAQAQDQLEDLGSKASEKLREIFGEDDDG